jgi:DNA mismatch repair protein MutL
MNDKPPAENLNIPQQGSFEDEQEFPTAPEKEEIKKEESIFSQFESAPSFQIHNQYIVAQIKSGFIVIDQQAAHERVLFEKYIYQLQNKKHFTQQQLFPQTLILSGADAAILSELLGDINILGFDVQPFGKDSFVIHGVPVEFESGNEQKVIEGLIEQFKEDRSAMKLNKHVVIAKSLSRTNSIKRGQKLDEREMRHLTDELFACSIPYVSPFGTLTLTTFTLDELAKQFQKNN